MRFLGLLRFLRPLRLLLLLLALRELIRIRAHRARLQLDRRRFDGLLLPFSGDLVLDRLLCANGLNNIGDIEERALVVEVIFRIAFSAITGRAVRRFVRTRPGNFAPG